MGKIFKVMAVIAAISVSALFSFTVNATEIDNLNAGKQALLTDKDIMAAYAYFNSAVANNPDDEAAHLWRAITVISQNSDLMDKLQELEILNSSGIFAVLDAEYEPTAYNKYNVKNQIIDDTAAAYSGDWVIETNPANGVAYDQGYRYRDGGTGVNTVTWTPNIIVPGYYSIEVWMPGRTGSSHGAEYVINYAGGTLSDEKFVDQHAKGWQRLSGKYYFTAGTLNSLVLYDDSSSGIVTADAVNFIYQGNYTDDSTTGAFQATGGGWTLCEGGNENTHYEHAAGAGAAAEWTLDVPRANTEYVVSAHIAGGVSGMASSASYTISPANGVPVTVEIGEYNKNSGDICLGVFTFTETLGNTVTLNSSADGIVIADSVKIAPTRPFPDLTEAQTLSSGSDGTAGMLNQISEAIDDLSYITDTFNDTVGFVHCPHLNYDMTLDYGEAKAFESALYYLAAVIEIDAVYNMDNVGLEKLMYENSSLNPMALFQDYGNFMYLRDSEEIDQELLLSNAKDALVASIDSYFDASEFIRSRDDDDGLHHAIMFYEPYDVQNWDSYDEWLEARNESLSMEDSVSSYLADLQNNLVSPEDYPYVTIPATLPGMDGGPGMDINIDFNAFFSSPRDVRSLMESLPMDGLIRDGDIPDPTFGGILPDFGPEDWNAILGNGPVFDGDPVAKWDGDTVDSITLNWNVSEDDNSGSIVRYEIYRSVNPSVSKNDENSTLVATISDKNVLTYADTSVDGASNQYYYVLYTYYDFGSGVTASTHTEAAKATLRIYVNANAASGQEDGTKENPAKDLGDAIRQYANAGTKVCVAAGTYDECGNSLNIWSNKSGLVLEGGYDASTWQRDIAANETIIDASNYPNSTGIGMWEISDLVIDGLTVTNATGQQAWTAGIQLQNAQRAIIRNCKITNCNRGIAIDSGSTCLVDNCRVNGRGDVLNSAEGISVNSSDSVTSAEIRNCVIKNWKTVGIVSSHNSFAGSATVVNNLIIGNKSNGISCSGSASTVLVTNNTIAGNGANAGVGYSSIGSMTIKDNIIAGNTGFGILCGSGAAGEITYNNLFGNSSGASSGCSELDPTNKTADDPKFVDAMNGDLHLQAGSPCIDAGSGPVPDYLQSSTTRSDGIPDSGIVDMGYHYFAPVVISSPTDLVIDFGGSFGVWIYDDKGNWSQLHTVSPESVTAADLDGDKNMDIVIDFGSADGIWIYKDDGTWSQLHNVSPESITAADLNGDKKTDLVIDFGGTDGIWIYKDDGTWLQLHNVSPESITTADLDGDGSSDLVIDFGADYGIWIYKDDGTWSQLHNVSPESITAADLNGDKKTDLIIDFGSADGIWIYKDDGTWIQLHNVSPKSITDADLDGDGSSDLVIDFGGSFGVWIYKDDGNWAQLHTVSPESITDADLDGDGSSDLVIDFGSADGIWIYKDDGTWTQLHNVSPESITAGVLNTESVIL